LTDPGIVPVDRWSEQTPQEAITCEIIWLLIGPVIQTNSDHHDPHCRLAPPPPSGFFDQSKETERATDCQKQEQAGAFDQGHKFRMQPRMFVCHEEKEEGDYTQTGGYGDA
jgi:hypothetical protein